MRQWTKAGRDRQNELVEALKQEERKTSKELEGLRCGQNAGNENDQIDFKAFKDKLEQVCNRRRDAEQLLVEVRVAPVPRQFETAQVGHQIRVRYLDDSVSRHRGFEETFILGGIGESDTDSPVRTYACDTAFGKALVRKEVGDTATVIIPKSRENLFGERYQIEILSIELPGQQPAANAA